MMRRARHLRVKAAMLSVLGLVASPATAAPGPARTIAPLIVGDEPVVVVDRSIPLRTRRLTYEVRTGRLPIRVDRSGEVRGYIFFVAYVVRQSGPPRPITFAWNGGPLAPAAIVHLEGIGPRMRKGDTLVDNPETLLTESDLVFMDPVETGFSRPARPEFSTDFLSLRGDVNSTAEFIRGFRARFGIRAQPTFLLGESYGAFRAAALADLLTEQHSPLAGVILISGDIPNIAQPPAFYDAMHVSARTAAAFFRRRLDPALQADRAATMREVATWSRSVYQPALERVAALSPAEREKVAENLARYSAFPLARVNRTTLVVTAGDYLRFALAEDGSKPLSENDLRIGEDDPGNESGDPGLIDSYIRGDLGYATDLTYAGLETGYTPFPGAKLPTVGSRWEYNQPGVTPAVLAEFRSSGEVSPIARVNPPWIVDALKRDPALRVFVATGRFDPLNMCEGDVLATATLLPALSRRIDNRCYESGHIVLRDPAARTAFLTDVRAFIHARQAQ